MRLSSFASKINFYWKTADRSVINVCLKIINTKISFWSKTHQVYWKSLNSFADCDRERCLRLNIWLNSILLFKTEAMFQELQLFFFTYDQVEERRDNSWLNLPNHVSEMKRCLLIIYCNLFNLQYCDILLKCWLKCNQLCSKCVKYIIGPGWFGEWWGKNEQ